jgi:putative ABC transport system substrate-binding protein
VLNLTAERYVRRRDFMKVFAGSAIAWPLVARGQQAGRLPTVGFLGVDPLAWGPWTAAFVGRLRELGWTEGRTIAIEYRWAEGHPERDAEFAAEFVRLKVEVIVTFGTAVPTVKRATAVIPIVFAVAQDPVGGGLVTNLARPGGNVTGQSSQATDVAGKRLQLLREVVPRLRRLAILVDFTTPQSVLEMGEVQAAARTLGIEVAPLAIHRAEDIAPAFEALKAQVDALYVVTNALVNANRTHHHARAQRAAADDIQYPRSCPSRGVSCPTDQTTWLSSGTPPSMSKQDSARDEARRSSSRATDQIRSSHQLDHC